MVLRRELIEYIQPWIVDITVAAKPRADLAIEDGNELGRQSHYCFANQEQPRRDGADRVLSVVPLPAQEPGTIELRSRVSHTDATFDLLSEAKTVAVELIFRGRKLAHVGE